MTSPRPFQCGRSNATTSTPEKASAQGGERGLVRAVADADEQRPLVQPDRVAPFDAHGLGELGRDRHVRRDERGGDRVGLAAPALLARTQEHRALVADEHGVVHVHRVRVARVVARHDDLGTRRLEQPAEELVLCRGRRVVGRGPPAVRAPVLGVLGERRPHEHALEPSGHGLRAEASHRGTLHRVRRRAALEENGAQRGHDESPHREPSVARRARDVRRQHDVLEREQLLRDRGLVLEDVERGAGDRALARARRRAPARRRPGPERC